MDFPALLDVATQVLHPLSVSESFLVGRNETADICVFDETCSRHHFRIVLHDGQHCVEPLSGRNPTYRNGQVIAGRLPLAHGDVLQAGQTRLQYLVRPATQATLANVPAAPVAGATVLRGPGTSAGELVEGSIFNLAGVQVIGRLPDGAQIHLPHPQVSRQHACIAAAPGNSAILTDLNSANGTYVNGRRLQGATTLRPGDHIDIGPYALQFTGTALVPRVRSDNIELVARKISRVVTSRETGQPMKLLDDINLVIRPREFVCLLGPSGSGKSTLLSTLSGRAPTDDGMVLVNGQDLHANFDALKQDIALVPQKDVLHDTLTVERALWYTAKLRLPPDTTSAEIAGTLAEMLETVGLTQRRSTLIRHLSGGQVKRASLANEILCKPSLLFLDEVTSGLDEQTDREVMNLFRTLADAGKTVVCITHSLANVERTCHLVVILTAGGKLAFVGKPAEALEYFGIDRLGDVYDMLKRQPAEHWQRAFLASPFHNRYVMSRLPPGPAVPETAALGGRQRFMDQLRLLGRQTLLLTRRYANIWRGDSLSLLAMLGQALVVAVLLGILFGNLSKLPRQTRPDDVDYAQRSVSLMFLLAVSSFWFGCNNAAKEIVKERTIYTRERNFNLRLESYYASKLLLLTLFSCTQSTVLFGIVRYWCQLEGSWFGELTLLLTLSLSGVTLGLAISAFSSTEEMAITLIPMAVIPQIILSGAITKLEGLSKSLAQLFISTYWGKCGLDACLPASVTDKLTALEKSAMGASLSVLLAHTAACVLVAMTALYFQDSKKK